MLKQNRPVVTRTSVNALCVNDISESTETHAFVRYGDYRKISNISRTKSSHLNVSRLVLQLSLPNPIKPGVKSRMKM